jgi:Domain of unknown function (DUF4157)
VEWDGEGARSVRRADRDFAPREGVTRHEVVTVLVGDEMRTSAKALVRTCEPEKSSPFSPSSKKGFSPITDAPLEQIYLLQGTIGNRQVERLLKSGANQLKLKIGEAGDVYEHEARQISEEVIRMPEPQLQRASNWRQGGDRRESEQLGAGHDRLQTTCLRSSDTGKGAVRPLVNEVLRAPGEPLDSTTRASMEARFGRDLGQVRVHADQRAAQSARGLNALAYTVGKDIVFGAGQYRAGSSEGRKLIAHELTHVLQQGFARRAIQRQPKKQKDPPAKNPTTNPKLVHDEIKKRNPDLAELITPASIDFRNPKEPPAIKGGPMKGGEEHLWKVRVSASQGFRGSQIVKGGEKRLKMKGGVQVTHFLDITWALPLATGKEFLQQTSSPDEAFTLTAAVPLYHELLHARLMMEGDPNWTSQHTQVFLDFMSLMQIANSAAVDKERQALKKEIGPLAAGGGQVKDVALAQDNYYEFLVHEKYDADTAGKAFGKSYSNALIAKNYSKVVALRLVPDDFPALKVLTDKLAAAAEKLFDKLDQAAKTTTPNPPTGSPPATKQPEK